MDQPTMLQICFPPYNPLVRFEERMISAMLDDMDDWNTTALPTRAQKEKYQHYAELFSKHLNRLFYFGHGGTLEAFVKPGELTTRHDIHTGLFNEISKRIPTFNPSDVCYTLKYQNECFIDYFEPIFMPVVTDLIESLDKAVERFPPPQNTPSRTCQVAEMKKYLSKLIGHIPEKWHWILKGKIEIPKALAMRTPYLRVLESEFGDKFVFVDEVRVVLDKLKKIKLKSYFFPTAVFFFFPFDLLEYALGLFGVSVTQIQLFTHSIGMHTAQGVICPSTENGLRGDTSVMRLIHGEGIKAAKIDSWAKDFKVDYINLFLKSLKTGFALPFFIVNQSYYPLRCQSERDAVQDALRTPSISNQFKRKYGSKPKPRIEPKEGRASNELFRDASQYLPQDCLLTGVQTLYEYPELALSLHEHGMCKPGEFCFAERFEVDVPYTHCLISEESMKKRVEFFLKKDFYNKGKMVEFRKKIDNEYHRNPRLVKEEDAPILGAPEGSFSDQVMEEKSDSSNSRRESGSSNEPNTETPSPNPPKIESTDDEKESRPEETEKELPKERIDSETSEDPGSSESSECDRLYETLKSGYDKMMKMMDAEHKEEIDMWKKSWEDERAKYVESKKTIEKQKTEIRCVKIQVEILEKEKKQETDRLSGDVKRITADKMKLENDFTMLQTKKAIEKPEKSQAKIAKLEEQLKKNSESANAALKQKDAELRDVRKKLEELNDAQRILQSQNDALVAAALHRDEQSESVEELMEKHAEEMEEMQRAADEKEQSEKSASVQRELENLKRHAVKEEILATEIHDLRGKLTDLTDVYECLLQHSTPACAAAVKRMTEIKNNLKRVRNEESRYKYAEVQLEEYIRMEDPANWKMCEAARSHLALAQAERLKYEMTLIHRLATIRNNIPLYFTLSECHFDNLKPFPEPFMPATFQRMKVLEREQAAKQRQNANNARKRGVSLSSQTTKKNKWFAKKNND